VPLISHGDIVFGPNNANDNDFDVPEDLLPFFDKKPLENNLTADETTLWWAPEPYNRCSGRIRHAQNISLVKEH
jgi:pre-mRNA-processing factor 8